MSLVTLAIDVGTKILDTTIDDILGAFRLQSVGRNSSGAPASGQDLGTVDFPWGVIRGNSLVINSEPIDTTNIIAPGNRVISGAARTNSEQPQFLDIDGVNDNVTVLGTTTTLELSINATAVSVEADILFSNLTEAPAANNTCLVNDATLTDQLSSKYTGEDETTLTIGTVGSEISSRVGELIALKKNGASEIMLAYVKSVTELTNIYRGFFYDSSDAPIVRETLADGDQLDIMSLGWIFVENTGTTGEIIYTNPIYSFTEPAAPTAALYWFDMATNTWKRGSGAAFVQINRTLVGLVVIDATKSIGYRCVDFYYDYRDTNTIDLEIFSDEVIRSKDKTNDVYIYSKTLRIDPTKITWDNTADMETGSVAASTTYYLYEASTGQRVVSLEKYYNRNDLRGRYHPYEAWRLIGEGITDGTSDWLTVSSVGPIANIIGNLTGNVTGNLTGIADSSETVVNNGDDTNLKVKSLHIGTWDMSSATGSATVNVAHGLAIEDIISVTVIIQEDLQTYKHPLDSAQTGTVAGYWRSTATNIELYRTTGGLFDNANYNGAIQRGFVTIWYDT